MRSVSVALLIALVLPAAPAVGCDAGAPTPPSASPAPGRSAVTPNGTAGRGGGPALRVRKQVTGLDHPWDVQPIGHRRLLITERDRARLSVWENGRTHPVRFPGHQVWVAGETGLMSLEVDPDFARNGRFYTCQGGTTTNGHEVHVLAWHLDDAATRARKVEQLIGGFPTSTGRHGGCRLLILRDGSLLVGTGDAAVGTNPEDLTSLGGKTLRLDRHTGAPWPTNPFVDAQNRKKRYVQTYGHRNVQGLAQRRDGTLWSIEQGTYRDDEVNRLVDGGDYGYNPVPGYNEDVPMTDQSLAGHQVEARWSSGDPTLATSGGTFVRGKEWGVLDGALAVAALKAGRIVFLTFDAAGHLQAVRAPSALQQFGRLRSVTVAPNHDLLVTTDNGNGSDAILRVSPR